MFAVCLQIIWSHLQIIWSQGKLYLHLMWVEKRDVCGPDILNTPNNVAKNMIDFSITIFRERLRPNYGDGFKGVKQNESQRAQQKEISCEPNI